MLKKRIIKIAQILAKECEEGGYNCNIVNRGKDDNYNISVKGGNKPKKKNKETYLIGK